MKPNATIISLLLFTAILYGCHKKQAAQSPFLNARVNNTSFNGACNTYFGKNAAMGDTFIVYGYNTDQNTRTELYPQIKLCLVNYKMTIGTFYVGGNSGNTAYYVTSPATSIQAAYGAINITSITTGIENSPPITGTFSFTCTDSTVVSNGAFMVWQWYGLE